MPTAIINPSNLTFNGKEVRDISEVVIAKTYAKPALNQIMTLVSPIEAKQQIAILGRLSDLTVLDPGCGLGAASGQVPTSQKFWNPQRVKFWLEFCWKDFVATFMVYLQRKGIQRPDMTDTAVADFIAELLPDALYEDFLRITWFNSTTATLVGAGSGDANVTAGTTIGLMNIIDGIWKQVIGLGAGAKTTGADAGGIVAANAAASFALQDSTLTPAGVAKDLDALTYNADLRLRGDAGAVIEVTQSVYDKAGQYLRASFPNIEAAYMTLQNGVRVLSWNGYPVIPISYWDRLIRSKFSNGTKYDLPHRALMTTLGNIQAGVDDTSAIGDFEIWYERKAETVNFRGGYFVDAKEIEDYMVKAVY